MDIEEKIHFHKNIWAWPTENGSHVIHGIYDEIFSEIKSERYVGSDDIRVPGLFIDFKPEYQALHDRKLGDTKHEKPLSFPN